MSINLSSLAIKFKDGELSVLDQQALPLAQTWLACHQVDDMCAMIKSLQVRGAPLIGIAAVLALMQYVMQGATIAQIQAAAQKLVATRPTAVNLKNYMQNILAELGDDPQQVLITGQRLFWEDVTLCDHMAEHGVTVLPENAQVMTYCNTGGLATAGCGTALGVIKKAFLEGKIQHVYPCETRPLLQGGRLTAWELEQAKIPYTLICDNMAAMVMKQKHIDAIFVGADRIALNGDTANKIGTYALAVLARHHRIPFYVVAPYTTLCTKTQTGDHIVIELRDGAEVRGAMGRFEWTLPNTPVFNPSFDVTPHELITGYILDKGIFKASDLAHLAHESLAQTA